MSLNSDYMLAPSLQEFFVDKSNGLPLTAGQVFFYSDVNRTQLKNIYTISGNPPNYSYVALPNPVTLTGVGTFTDDNNNDVLPYYYPFDAQGNIELYYIQVFDQNGLLQFTREGWPNFTGAAGSQSEVDFTNFVPNGQFLTHNLNQPLSILEFDSTGIDYTPVAQGGWYFARSHGSTATDMITFPVFQNYVAFPTGSPRFAINLNRSVGSSDSVCDFRLRFYDVNKFSDPVNRYFLQFTSQSNSGSTLNNVGISLYKYFGTGTNSPSSPLSIPIKTADIPPTETDITVEINFPINDPGITIGNNNDDFVEICINFNAGSSNTFSVQLTDVILTPFTNQTSVTFPTTTDSEMLSESIAGFMPVPNPDGSDLYLPLKLTAYGLQFDHSEVGKIQSAIYKAADPLTNELLCDGSQYKFTDYSPIGIPYSRLGNVLISNSPISGIPLYGTGSDYLTAYIAEGVTPSSTIRQCTNKPIMQTASLDGATATGFTFSVGTSGSPTSSGYGFTSYNIDNNRILCESTFLSGFYSSAEDHTGGALTIYDYKNVPGIPYVFSISINSSPTAGTYFNFDAPGIPYYMWFKVGGVGIDPAPAGRGPGIAVNLELNYSTNDIINAIREAISGYSQNIIEVTSGATITAGSYFSIYANNQQYIVWYYVNGSGTEPSIGGAINLKVSINSSDSDSVVLDSTANVINNLYFAVPDFRGMFLRGWDNGKGVNSGYEAGLNLSYLYGGNNLGTFQLGCNELHDHTVTIDAFHSPGGITGGGGLYDFPSTSITTDTQGDNETRPINATVNYIIKY